MRSLLALATIMLFVTSCRESGPGSTQKEESAAKTKIELEDSAIEEAVANIVADTILEGVKVLSADDMEGRATGTPGERKAAGWIAAQFDNAGLVPMGDGFFQKVSLVGYKKNPETSTLTLQSESGPIAYTNEETLTYWSTSQKQNVTLEAAPLLFVGYGVEAPEYGWDDFKGVDCSGKVLVFLNNDPQTGNAEEFGGEARTYYGRYTYKFEQAAKKGAAGAIMIHTTPSAGYGWSVIGSVGSREAFALKLPGAGYQLDFLAWINQDLADRLAGLVDADLDSWFTRANSRDFQPVPLPVTLDCSIDVMLNDNEALNVVGVWEGSHPELKNEYVLFSAHYDHLGKKDEGEGDLIYNGAWDNAMGTVAIVEIAKALSKANLRPARSIAFLACSGEEKGLLGSQWFAANPPVPLKRVVANLNIDMPQIFGLTQDMVALGYDTNSVGEALVRIASETKVSLSDGSEGTVAIKGDQNPNAGSFYRSDQVSFAKAGVPALFLLPGVDFVSPPKTDPEEYHAAHYHQLSDEVSELWDLAGCERDMRVVLKLAVDIAQSEELPRWNPGNEFEAAWKDLHQR